MSTPRRIRHLAALDYLDFLPRLFGTIFIPSIVYEELQHPAAPQTVRAALKPPPAWLKIILTAVIDAAARRMGFSFTGTLGILILTAERQWLDLADAFAPLRHTNFHCSEDFLQGLLSRHGKK